MNRIGKTLSEFVQFKENRNVMSKFLEGADLNSFKFVGFQRNFEEELQRLSKVMNWNSIKNLQLNTTDSKPRQIDQHLIELIEFNNQEDISLYKEALNNIPSTISNIN